LAEEGDILDEGRGGSIRCNSLNHDDSPKPMPPIYGYLISLA